MHRPARCLLLIALLAGCAPSPWKQLSQGRPTEDLLKALISPDESFRRPIRDDGHHGSRQGDAAAFRRLPNPGFVLYLMPRLVGDSIVPGYQTRFQLYLPPAPWALPTEVAACTGCPPQ